MGMNTLRNYKWSWRALGGLRFQPTQRPGAPRRVPQAATYWRRRFVALLIGLAILALVAWAFSGALGGGSTGQSGATHSGGGQSGTGQGAGSGQSGSGHGVASQASTGLGGGKAGPGSHGKSAADRRSGRPPACHHGDVVLSLFSSQEIYSARQLPQFTVDVVGTGHQICTFNVGARHVVLLVHAGTVRVWSSADCVQGAGSLISDLQRGIPTVLPISWNRQTSSPGCPARSPGMPAGTYSAIVNDGTLTSNSVTFKVN
jgi:hypothetical protein